MYALTTETIKHGDQIDSMMKRLELFEKEPRLDPYLAAVLITELLWGKMKLPGKSKPEKTILAYSDSFDIKVNNMEDTGCKGKFILFFSDCYW